MSSVPSLWQLAKRSVFLWVGLLFVPIGLIFLCVGVSLALEERAFEKTGSPADATIIDRSLQRADFEHNPSTRYLIRYRFRTPAGDSIEQTKEVSVEEWERLPPGSTLTIQFLANAPAEARMRQQSNWPGAATFSALGLILLGVGVPLVVFAARETLRQWRLWRTGSMVPAVVTAVVPSATVINGVQQWEIRYAYTDASGRKREGRSNCMPEQEAKQWHRGNRSNARVDPRNPASSIWVGTPALDKAAPHAEPPRGT
jgi:hypothetical protein